MPARKPPPLDEMPQRERFIEAALEVGASEDPVEFERVFAKILLSQPAAKSRPLPEEGQDY